MLLPTGTVAIVLISDLADESVCLSSSHVAPHLDHHHNWSDHRDHRVHRDHHHDHDHRDHLDHRDHRDHHRDLRDHFDHLTNIITHLTLHNVNIILAIDCCFDYLSMYNKHNHFHCYYHRSSSPYLFSPSPQSFSFSSPP